jgi:hypothetical protein
MSHSDREWSPETMVDYRLEAEIYSAAVSVPTVPGDPAWLARYACGNPFAAALSEAPDFGELSRAAGPWCLAKQALDYGSFDGREALRYPLYLTREGFWSREIAEAVRLDAEAASALLVHYPNYTEGGRVTPLPTIERIAPVCTKYPELFAALAAPFAAGEVKVRTQAGRQMSYVTARTVMNRLDTVVGPENWADEYESLTNSVVGRLTITLPDGRTVTKVDAGGGAGMADEGDDDKSAFSDAFKRVAVKFGVGRYLYRDGVASLLPEAPAAPAIAAEGSESPTVSVWNPSTSQYETVLRSKVAAGPATLPMSKPTKPAAAAPATTTALPEIKTARELYAWARGNHVIQVISEIGRHGGLPFKIIDWTDGNARAVWETYVEGLPGFGLNGTDG